jgi:hypothetical protein
MVQVCYLSAAGDLLTLGVDGNAVDGVLEEHVAAVLEDGAGGVVQLVGVRRRLEYLHRPPRLGHTCIRELFWIELALDLDLTLFHLCISLEHSYFKVVQPVIAYTSDLFFK